MADSPKDLIDALNLITAVKAPRLEAVGGLGVRHFTHVRSVFDDPNILGVGISEKVSGGKKTGELCVCFYVEKKLPPAKVRARHMVPPVLAGTGRRAVYTDVKAVGRLRPQVNKERSPIESGFSAGHFNVTAGTVGAIVKKKGGSSRYLLSNSHVLADSGRGKKGDPILYPGKADGGKRPADQIAKLDSFVPFTKGGSFVNLVDAALAQILPDRTSDVSYNLPGTKTPLGTITPKRNMMVTKRGRTTGTTSGRIVDTDFRFVLPYPGVGPVGYTRQVLCERYTDGGDSGSLVIDKATGKVVGLHFAGANGGSVFSPIAEVVKTLSFQFTRS